MEHKNLIGSATRKYHAGHAFFSLFAPKKFAQSYPEIYPIYNGKRIIPSGYSWEPCLTEPKTIDIAVKIANEQFKSNRGIAKYGISFGMNDCPNWCECSACQKIMKEQDSTISVNGITFDGSASYLYWGWLNEVAKRIENVWPDKKIVGLAYSNVIAPPKGIKKLNKNILAYITFDIGQLRDPVYAEQVKSLITMWREKGVSVGIHEYLFGTGYAVPRIYTRGTADFMKWAVKNGVIAYYAETYPNFILDGAKYKINYDTVIHPDRDTEKEWKQFCKDLFGNSWKEMYGYWSKLSENLERTKRARGLEL